MLAEQYRYAQSLKQLEKAERVIPLGAQTVSKSRLTLPPGIAPLYATHASGCKIWDVDGNEYIDSLADVLALSKKRKLAYGTPGQGSIPHLGGAYIFNMLSKAMTRPGIDPRSWCSLAIVQSVVIDEAAGVFCDVLLMPS